MNHFDPGLWLKTGCRIDRDERMLDVPHESNSNTSQQEIAGGHQSNHALVMDIHVINVVIVSS